MMFIRSGWDCQGNEAWIVIEETPEAMAPPWTKVYMARIDYGPLGTRVDLGQVVASDLKMIKATASERARRHGFVPRREWAVCKEEYANPGAKRAGHPWVTIGWIDDLGQVRTVVWSHKFFPKGRNLFGDAIEHVGKSYPGRGWAFQFAPEECREDVLASTRGQTMALASSRRIPFQEWVHNPRARGSGASMGMITVKASIHGKAQEIPVEAVLVDGLAVHQAIGYEERAFAPYVVTHVASGLKIAGDFSSKAGALSAARTMAREVPGYFSLPQQQMMADPRAETGRALSKRYQRVFKTPEGDIRQFMGQVHVGTSGAEVERLVREHFGRYPYRLKGPLMKGAVEFALREHQKNQRTYAMVMSGSL
jgi:hypothetical protein